MAFNGKLIEIKISGAYVTLPYKYMKAESYKVTPNQRMESSAKRATTGYLSRTTCSHTASKIEFETPSAMSNKDIAQLNTMFHNAFTSVIQKNITIRYYDPETDSYKEADCYMPDVDYDIMRVDTNDNAIVYNSVRYAFIEY